MAEACATASRGIATCRLAGDHYDKEEKVFREMGPSILI